MPTAIAGLCSVNKAVIAWGEVVALAYVVIVGCFGDWHLRLLELLAHLGWPLVTL
jgi:hypothetical protein